VNFLGSSLRVAEGHDTERHLLSCSYPVCLQVAARSKISPNLLALALSNVLQLLGFMQW
jgi:hypothetical protein